MASESKNFELYKGFMENQLWNFEAVEEDDIYIQSGLSTEKLTIPFTLLFENEDIVYQSTLPFKAKEDIQELITEITRVNSEHVKYGKFEFDFESRKISYVNYAMTNGINPSEEFIKKHIISSCLTIDRFAPRLQKTVLT